MKKTLVLLGSFIITTSVMAQQTRMHTYVESNYSNNNSHQRHHHRPRQHNTNSSDWVVPALVGGAVLYGIGYQTGMSSREPQVQQVPAYGVPPPTVHVQPAIPPTYAYRWVWDEQMSAWKWQLVQL